MNPGSPVVGVWTEAHRAHHWTQPSFAVENELSCQRCSPQPATITVTDAVGAESIDLVPYPIIRMRID